MSKEGDIKNGLVLNHLLLTGQMDLKHFVTNQVIRSEMSNTKGGGDLFIPLWVVEA